MRPIATDVVSSVFCVLSTRCIVSVKTSAQSNLAKDRVALSFRGEGIWTPHLTHYFLLAHTILPSDTVPVLPFFA